MQSIEELREQFPGVPTYKEFVERCIVEEQRAQEAEPARPETHTSVLPHVAIEKVDE